jgi:hypothetical protein
MKQILVYPLYTGFRDTPFTDDYPANYKQAEAVNKQGAAWLFPDTGAPKRSHRLVASR